jgi:hypothetical protein
VVEQKPQTSMNESPIRQTIQSVVKQLHTDLGTHRTVTLVPRCGHALAVRINTEEIREVAVRINTDEIQEEAFLDGRGTLGSNLIMTSLLLFTRNMPVV